MLENVKRWAALVVPSHPHEIHHFEGTARILSIWERELRIKSGELVICRGKYRHDALYLLQAVFQAFLVQGVTKHFWEVLQRSLAQTCPDFVMESMMVGLQRHLVVSPKTIFRTAFSLDVAIMLWCRQKHFSFQNLADGYYRYILSDSSPQEGQDWIWTEWVQIAHSKTIPTFKAVLALQAAVARILEQLQRDADKEAGQSNEDQEQGDRGKIRFQALLHQLLLQENSWSCYLTTLEDALLRVTCSPVALGSGHRDVVHKCAAIAFSWSLHVGATNLERVMGEVVSHTTDLGVEHQLADFKTSNPLHLLPAWMQNNDMSDDLLDLQDLSQADDEMTAQFGPSLEPSVDTIAAASVEDNPMYLEHCMQSQCFMDNALSVAGLQHLCHNLTQDVHEHMPQWNRFFDDLHVLQKLLAHPDRKERFIWSCIRDTPFADQEKQIKSFAARLYEPRWGAVVGFMRALQPLLNTLTNAWDALKYSRHGGGTQP